MLIEFSGSQSLIRATRVLRGVAKGAQSDSHLHLNTLF